MPDEPLVRIGVSWQTPKALIIGGDSFLGQNFLQRLKQNQLEITAVVSSPRLVKDKEGLTILKLEDNWKDRLPETIDYIVDFLGLPETPALARRQKARLMTVADLEQNSSLPPLSIGIDQRIVQTAFVYGPQESIARPTLLNGVILQAVTNEKIDLPVSENGKIFPLYIDDFCSFLENILFSPSFDEKVTLVGEETSWQEFLQAVEEESQHTQGVKVDSEKTSPLIDATELMKLRRQYGWDLTIDWQEGLKKTLQFFFQKKEKQELGVKEEELEKTTTPTLKTRIEENIPVETKLPVASSASEKEESTAAPFLVNEEFWDKEVSERPPKKVKKKKKTKKKKAQIVPRVTLPEDQTVVINEDWQAFSPPTETALETEVPVFDKTEEVILSEMEEKPQKKEIPLKKGKKRFFPGAWLLASVLGILLWWFFPAILWGIYFSLGGWRLNQTLKLVKAGGWDRVQQEARLAEVSLSKSLDFAEIRSYEKLISLSRLSKRGAQLAAETAYLLRLTESLTDSIWIESADQGSLLPLLTTHQETLRHELALFEAEIGGKTDFLPFSLRKETENWRSQIKEAQQILAKTSRILPHIEWLLGKDRTRRFLVLIQNNTELRPTGGFIGSYALVSFDAGKLIDFDVEDIYSADGQLRGHVEPPEPIKKYLGQNSWYLRDSNWSPDFPASAEKAKWFFDKETGMNVDGVIAINLDVVKKILEKTGEISLPDFGEKISAENLFAKAEFYAENSFFPGSQQKASFLTALGKQILVSFQESDSQRRLKTAKSLWQSLEEKEMMVWTVKDEVNQMLLANNWDGRLKNMAIDKENSFADYLLVAEANLGINKANYFLKRGVNLMVKVNETGQVERLLQINYENLSQSDKWPGGDYKNYLRLFLPADISLEKALVFDPDKGRSTSEIRIGQQEMTVGKEKGKTSVGFLVTVPVSGRRVVEVSYKTKADLKSGPWSYLLYWQKQSGSGVTPVTILLTTPSVFKPVQVLPAATQTDEGLVFSTFLKTDLPVAVEFDR